MWRTIFLTCSLIAILSVTCPATHLDMLPFDCLKGNHILSTWKYQSALWRRRCVADLLQTAGLTVRYQAAAAHCTDKNTIHQGIMKGNPHISISFGHWTFLPMFLLCRLKMPLKKKRDIQSYFTTQRVSSSLAAKLLLVSQLPTQCKPASITLTLIVRWRSVIKVLV